MSEERLEAPEADAAEQEADIVVAEGDEQQAGVPLEADPADAADQAREVAADEDEDYR
jgi:hypothetical protein